MPILRYTQSSSGNSWDFSPHCKQLKITFYHSYRFIGNCLFLLNEVIITINLKHLPALWTDTNKLPLFHIRKRRGKRQSTSSIIGCSVLTIRYRLYYGQYNNNCNCFPTIHWISLIALQIFFHWIILRTIIFSTILCRYYVCC